MENLIKSKLCEIEAKEQVKIIHAVESGSRAWGFASPDSDYDVRFIYIRPRNEYLRLEKRRDVIEYMLDDVYDINGWDLQKALRLLHKSNPTLFEWCNSPIVYQTTPFYNELKEQINTYFSRRSGLRHYLQTAKGNYREYLQGEQVKLKKYFYVLRPLLACRWILEYNCPPPMLFSELVEAELPEKLAEPVKELLRIKMEMPEIGEGKRIDVINDYIETELTAIEDLVNQLPKEDKKSWEKLNQLFLQALSEFNF